MARSLSTIAREIRSDYASKGKPVYYAAEPYVAAMETMNTISDGYYYDTGEDVVTRGLHNLSYWRGPVATRVKRELKVMLHEHNPRRYPMPK